MTAREFDRGALADNTVVALIPATEDYEWAAAQAWLVAREATRGKPRVALVDLSLNMPVLDHGAVRRTEKGIVDALLYDTSLTRIAQPQDEPGLHYLGGRDPNRQASGGVGASALEPARRRVPERGSGAPAVPPHRGYPPRLPPPRRHHHLGTRGVASGRGAIRRHLPVAGGGNTSSSGRVRPR